MRRGWRFFFSFLSPKCRIGGTKKGELEFIKGRIEYSVTHLRRFPWLVTCKRYNPQLAVKSNIKKCGCKREPDSLHLLLPLSSDQYKKVVLSFWILSFQQQLRLQTDAMNHRQILHRQLLSQVGSLKLMRKMPVHNNQWLLAANCTYFKQGA